MGSSSCDFISKTFNLVLIFVVIGAVIRRRVLWCTKSVTEAQRQRIFLSSSPIFSLGSAGRRRRITSVELSSNTINDLHYVVWLLSFPNSGTSYTLTNVQHITNTSAATNYGAELSEETAVRVRPDVAYSPFVLKPKRRLPEQVLTKTHCTGFSSTPEQLFVSQMEFFNGCRDTHFRTHLRKYYNVSAIVSKAVHLFRDPFDNLVSRKHLGVHIEQRDKGKWLNPEDIIVSDTPEGLLAWCRYIDDFSVDDVQKWSMVSEEIQEMMRAIPCSTDLFLYVQWHNRALEMTQTLGLDVHYLYYEDYDSNYQETVSSLLRYLNLNLTSAGFDLALPFQGNKRYNYLFRHRNFSKSSMTVFLRRVSTPETWSHIRRYVEAFYDEESDQSAESNNGR